MPTPDDVSLPEPTRRLILRARLAAAVVGERVGYLDAAYFARRFRQAHGMSARAYRQALR